MVVPGVQFFQAAWVVADLQQAMRRWLETARVGPFFVNAHVETAGLLYRGRPSSFDYSLAIAQAGSIQIELIEQHDAQPSVYRDSVSAGCDGFHHLACFAEDFDAELVRLNGAGVEIASSGVFGDMRFVYADTRSSLGVMTEVLENTPQIHRLFDAVAAEAQGWDGREPVRDLRSLL